MLSGLADYGFVVQRLLFMGSNRSRLYSLGWGDKELDKLEGFWMNLLSRLERGLPPEELEDGRGILNITFADEDFEVERFRKKKPEGSSSSHSAGNVSGTISGIGDTLSSSHSSGSSSSYNSTDNNTNNYNIMCGACRGRSRTYEQENKLNNIDLYMREGFAQSPLATFLQPGSERLQFLYVCGKSSTGPWESEKLKKPSSKMSSAPSPNRIVIILPSTGEQGYTDRIEVARSLISKDERTACLIVMAPYYAERKPTSGPPQRSFYARTVGDYQTQVAAISMEGAALLKWAHAMYPSAQLCVTGFSWGAGMACGAALLVVNALPKGVAEKQLAVVPYVGCSSPTPYITGIYSMDIDLPALEKDGGGGRTRLMQIFTRSTWKALVDVMKTSKSSRHLIGSLVSVTMIHDKFVPFEAQTELHKLMEECSVDIPQRRQLKTYGGGHAVAGFSTTTMQVDAIDTALKLLFVKSDE